ncbi:hypothetical protein BH23ACT6_BH23ACT6_03260 [soil metagenome]
MVGAAAVVLALAAVALIALGAVGLANVATPNMQGFNPGATVTVTDRGMSVYARSGSDRAGTVCTADDGSSTTLARPTSEFAVEVSGSDFYEVARAPHDLAAGSYALTCQGTEQALYVGPAAPNTTTAGLMGPASLVGGIVLGFFALVLMIIAIVMSRAARVEQAPAGTAEPSPSPYGSPSAPYGSQSTPPPPPSWGPPQGEPTQAIAYGQGQYGAAADGADNADSVDSAHDVHDSSDQAGRSDGDHAPEQDARNNSPEQDASEPHDGVSEPHDDDGQPPPYAPPYPPPPPQ